MKKFNSDLFLDLLSQKNYKQLIKKMSSLSNPDNYFAYALAKGLGFNKKGSFHNFLEDTYLHDNDPSSLKSTLNNLDKSIDYKSVIEIKEEDEESEYFLDVGLLSSKKIDKTFLLYSYHTTSSLDYPEVIKIYKTNEKINKKFIKDATSKRLKKEIYLPPIIKKIK